MSSDGPDHDGEAVLDARLSLSPTDLAQYIGDLTGSLSRLARDAKLDLLAHLLDVARMEAVQRSSPNRRLPHG